MKVNLPLGSTGTTGLPFSRTSLINCWNAGGKIIQRPGITSINTNARVARGAFEWNDSLYVVASQDLLKITDVSTGAYSVIGTITGTAAIDVAIGFNDAAIIVKGGASYTLDTSDVLTDTSGNTRFEAFSSVTFLNGIFVYIPSNGDPAKFSDVGDASTIGSTAFFDAEELPDKNKVAMTFRNTLYIGGSDSFQPFRNITTTASVPFQSLNARIDNGYIGGLIEFNNTFFFIGREKDQNLGIYALGNGSAPKISNEFIDTILETYTEEQLSDCIAGRFKHRGYDVATFTLANDSFAYFDGNWIELETYSGGDPSVWQAGYIQEFNTKYYSFYSNNIGVLAAVNTDYGNPFRRLIDMGHEADGEFSIQSLQYNISQGFNSSVGSVTLQVSDDNVLYGPAFQNNTGAQGAYMSKLVWNYPGGLGAYDTFMGIRLWTGEDIDFSGTSVDIDT